MQRERGGYYEECSDIGLPHKKGYVLEQELLDDENAMVAGAHEYHRFQRRLKSNETEERLERFLSWIKETYDPKLTYYPFSGWHTTPRETLGQDKVVHLSTDDCHPHLRDLAQGQRVQAEAFHMPFQEQSFDAVFIRGANLCNADQKYFFTI